MSAYTKRKHVTKEVEEFDGIPDGTSIVQVISGRGNNLHLVKTENGEEYLASMPTKFRKHVWVKRGDFVLVQPIEEGDKVRAEITNVLLKNHIKELKKEGSWPKAFDNQNLKNDEIEKNDDLSDSSIDLEDNPNYVNRNSSNEESENDSDSNKEESNSNKEIFDSNKKN